MPSPRQGPPLCGGCAPKRLPAGKCLWESAHCPESASFSCLPAGYLIRREPHWIDMLGGNQFRLRQGFSLPRKPLYGAMRRPALRGPGQETAAPFLFVQLENRQKCLCWNLYTAQRAHLFLVSPPDTISGGVPIEFACSTEISSASAKVFAPAKTLVRRNAPPRLAGPRARNRCALLIRPA